VCSRGELYTLVTRRADIQHNQPLGITRRTDTGQIQQVAVVCGCHGVGTRFGFHSAQFMTRPYTILVLAYSCQPSAPTIEIQPVAPSVGMDAHGRRSNFQSLRRTAHMGVRTQTGLHGSHWWRQRFHPAITHDILDSTQQSWILLPGIGL
jgi:hypothetical protein